MQEIDDTTSAFSTFRVLTGESNTGERDQLFRNMAQLFSFVSERCDDEQVRQYDDVLCQLADLVEADSRTHVAALLAPLNRTPGGVVVKLAHDAIEVARPLLEGSNALSDDDLIAVASSGTEAHRLAIAARAAVNARIGGAIAQHGERASIIRLIGNPGADLSGVTLDKLAGRAVKDAEIARHLEARTGSDWPALRDRAIARQRTNVEADETADVHTLRDERFGKSGAFNQNEWIVACAQVRAMNDRRQLDQDAVAHFARFGYGHHVAAALSVLTQIDPEVFAAWLAAQDYQAVTVALRAAHLPAELFEAAIAVMPWRDQSATADRDAARARFEALTDEEADHLFDMWRSHAGRRRGPVRERPSV